MPEDDVCGICRVQFDGTCPTCKYPGDDCALRMLSFNSSHKSIVTDRRYSDWDMWTLLSYGMRTRRIEWGSGSADVEKHCLLTWIQQDSSKGLCPMCRQSRSILGDKDMLADLGRIRVEERWRIETFIYPGSAGVEFLGSTAPDVHNSGYVESMHYVH